MLAVEKQIIVKKNYKYFAFTLFNHLNLKIRNVCILCINSLVMIIEALNIYIFFAEIALIAI